MSIASRANSVAVPSVDSSLCAALLPSVLSLVAGSSDVISFLGLDALFTAHITGNLCVLAAHLVTGGTAPPAPMLSVPVFIVALGLTRLLAGGLEAMQHDTLRPLLTLQFALLVGFFVLSIATGAQLHPDARGAVAAGMLGVAAMAVQNTLAQISLTGAPSTAVMTTNITRFMMDLGDILFHGGGQQSAEARKRAKHTWPAILGFAAGCALGATVHAAVGLWALALPTGLALLALGMGLAIEPAAAR
jgi:uncharacterized membrane protein YoaK (UPF0700 family)